MSNKHPKDNIGVGKGKGRPKGSLNKTTVSVKDAISMAAEGLGGTERLIAWAKEEPANERIFWGNIYPKLLPLQIAGDPDAPIVHEVRPQLTKDEWLQAMRVNNAAKQD